MEIIEKLLSPAGKNKLATYTEKQKPVPLYVVGIHVNETELICSKPKQASGQKSTGLPSITTHSKKVEWNGLTDYVIPPNCFDFLCTKEMTYRDVFSSFLKKSVLELLKQPENGVMIVAFSFPVHSLWNNSQENLQQLVDHCFADCTWLVPTVVPILDYGFGEDQDSFVYVDKNWTTFFLDKKQYSVAFGTDTDFHNFRCNDYLTNSTQEWTQKSYLSWEAGFADICRKLSELRKGTKQPFVAFAGKKYCNAIAKAIAGSGLAVGPVIWKNPADITAKAVFPSISKPNGDDKAGADTENRGSKGNRGHKQDGQKDEQQVKTAEDLFKW